MKVPSLLRLELHWLTTCPGTSTWTRPQKKANNTLAFLRRNISRYLSEIKAQCYTSLVRPVIEYAATPWDPYTARNIQQHEAVQRRAARFVTGDYKTSNSTSQMIANLGLSSLQQRRTEARLVMMYHITHDLVDIPVAQYLHPATVMHIRGPSQRYMLPFFRTDVYRHSFFHAGIRLLESTARACRHRPDLGLFQGWPSRPLLASYRDTWF